MCTLIEEQLQIIYSNLLIPSENNNELIIIIIIKSSFGRVLSISFSKILSQPLNNRNALVSNGYYAIIHLIV